MNRPLPREDTSRQTQRFSTCSMCACRRGIKVTVGARRNLYHGERRT